MKNKKILIAIITFSICLCGSIVIILCCMHKHDHIPVATFPTCQSEGYTTYSCSCGDHYIDDFVPKLGHDPISVGNYIEATCEEDGQTATIKCSRCQIIIEDQRVIEATGHNFVNGACSDCEKSQPTFEVSKVEFVYNGQTISTYSTELDSKDFQLSLKINDGVGIDDCLSPKITWEFVGESGGSSVSQEGVVTLGNVLGELTLCVTVEGTNKITTELPVVVTPNEGLIISSISAIIKEGYNQSYIEGDIFDKDSICVWGEHENGKIRILDYQFDQSPLNTTMTELAIFYDDKMVDFPITVNHRSLQSIEIASPAIKTEYFEGQLFDKTGLVIKANYENFSEIINDFDVVENGVLSVGQESIIINYTHNGITKSVEQNISVAPKKLLSICVDDSQVKKVYTQGDRFDINNLVVKASFESFEEIEIFDYQYDTKLLTTEDTVINISYTINEITKIAQIPIIVEKPYTQIKRLKVLNPADVSIIWSYSYVDNDGERVIDNTAYENNSLKYDRINGLYDIPLGAIVTASIQNPAVIDISINGIQQNIDYSEKTTSWIMGSEELVIIDSIEISGNHYVVRFTGDDKEQSFLYNGIWNGYLSEDNLNRIKLIFCDNDNYYYTYLINGEQLRFDDLSNIFFKQNTVITVTKNNYSIESKEITLHLDENLTYSILMDDNSTIEDLPAFTKPGYAYAGWSLSQDGENISDEDLISLLESEQSTYDLYIRWIRDTNILICSDLIGNWNFVVSDGENMLECDITFNSDGTFEYKLIYNEDLNSKYFGLYEWDGEHIIVLSVDTDMNIPLVNESEFNFSLHENVLTANLIVIQSDSIIFSTCEFEKISQSE